MKKHLQYASYIIRHKWFVFIAGLKIGAPLFRLLIHDWSKLLPSEWFPYANYFYGKGNKKLFDRAWNYHIKRNKHHWQYWVLSYDNGSVKCLEMPEKYIYEMVADWMGAGRAIHGYWDISEWYENNKHKMKLHPLTQAKAEVILISIQK